MGIGKKVLQKFVYYKKNTYLCTRLTIEAAQPLLLLRNFIGLVAQLVRATDS